MEILAGTLDPIQASLRFLTSLGIGLIMGLERERKAGSPAGLRTFAMVALVGTLSALLAAPSGGWTVPAALLALAATMVAADRRRRGAAEDPDVTTTVAVLLCFGLGAATWYGYAHVAVGVALLATALLHFKAELHGITHRLTRQDIVSILQFAAVTFVVLPLLPDTGYGPYGVVNPYRVWLVVVLTSAVSLAGYAALRIVPPRQAVPLLGLLGGSVSSTATTLVFARHIRNGTLAAEGALGVILVANLVVLLRITAIAAVLMPSLLAALAPVLGMGLLTGALASLRGGDRFARQRAEVPELRNPVGLRHSLGFALVFTLVLVAGAWVHDSAGLRGLYGMTAVSGLLDMDAITISIVEMQRRAAIDAVDATRAIVLAYGVNLAMKLALLGVIGGMRPLPQAAWHGAATLLGLAIGLVLLR